MTVRAAQPFPVAAPTPEERAARGKAARSEAPRSSHAEWSPSADRRSPVDIIEEQNAPRVPELVPVRHGRMLASAFTFYRGAAAIMAADLARTPTSGLEAQLCGDAHLSNFGAFAAPDRRLVFDCNDFDETLPGPFEWDVKRLVASLAIGGRDVGIGAAKRRVALIAAVAEYREGMRHFAGMRDLDVWYARIDLERLLAESQGLIRKRRRAVVAREIAKAQRKDSLRAFSKLTHSSNGEVRIVSDPPVITPIDELAGGQAAEEGLKELLAEYRDTLDESRRHLAEGYTYVHAARKVVGVGSVGTRAWIILLQGRDRGDPLFLQAKEAEASVLEPYAGKSRFEQHGRRVVEGQRLMQAASDIFLGWVSVDGIDGVHRDFYLRQLWDRKGSTDVSLFGAQELANYGRVCGRALARAHARSGDRIAIASYLGRGASFDAALAEFAEAYADQNELDYQAMLAAVDDGRLAVETGV
jgi:uncharacterized protein (DUF2252 family)